MLQLERLSGAEHWYFYYGNEMTEHTASVSLHAPKGGPKLIPCMCPDWVRESQPNKRSICGSLKIPEQCFLCVHKPPIPGSCWNADSDSVHLRWGWQSPFFYVLPGDTDAAGSTDSTLRNQALKDTSNEGVGLEMHPSSSKWKHCLLPLFPILKSHLQSRKRDQACKISSH